MQSNQNLGKFKQSFQRQDGHYRGAEDRCRPRRVRDLLHPAGRPATLRQGPPRHWQSFLSSRFEKYLFSIKYINTIPVFHRKTISLSLTYDIKKIVLKNFMCLFSKRFSEIASLGMALTLVQSREKFSLFVILM